MDLIKRLAQELSLGEQQVKAAVDLIDEGNTIPFIARYRKEATGSMEDTALRELDDELKVELLDIFLGFAVCTGRSAETDWEKQLRDKLTSHLPVFAGLVSSGNEDIAYFAERIMEEITDETE